MLLHRPLAAEEPDDELVKDAPKPQITQAEVLKALDLEMSKIRFVEIPPGYDLGLELTVSTKDGGRRQLAHMNVRPRGDSLDILMSAHYLKAGCPRIEVSFQRGEDPMASFVVNTEERFGKGKMAIYPHPSFPFFFHMTSNVFHFKPGPAYQLASFRLSNDPKYRSFSLQLFTYPIDDRGLSLRSKDGAILSQDPKAMR